MKINGREYAVTVETISRPDGTDPRQIYILTGKRGARYGTMRCLKDGKPSDRMFLVHAGTGFGIPAGLDRVRLTDRNGVLEVES